MISTIVGAILIAGIISVLIAVKRKRPLKKPPETGAGNRSEFFEEKWEHQLREIKEEKMKQEQKRGQIELITRKKNEEVKRIFWPRILRVCKKFAEAVDLKYGVVEIGSLRMDFVNYFGNNDHFGDDEREYYYTYPAKLCKIGLGHNEEAGVADKIAIYLITRYRFSNSSLESCIYIIPRKGYEREPARVIYIGQFTEEILVNTLREVHRSIERY